MTNEVFAKPCVAAIIESVINGERFILVQTRQKPGGGDTNGKIEIPAGKIREYECLFDALRREVFEETGLTVTRIHGESDSAVAVTCGHATLACTPFCVTQNLSGAYSIILNTFICQVEGTPLTRTDETENIRWMPLHELRRILDHEPDSIFFMHVHALRKYLHI